MLLLLLLWLTIVPGKLHADQLHTAAVVIVVIADEAVQLKIGGLGPAVPRARLAAAATGLV